MLSPSVHSLFLCCEDTSPPAKSSRLEPILETEREYSE